MSGVANDLEAVEMAKSHAPKLATPVLEKELKLGDEGVTNTSTASFEGLEDRELPTADDLVHLRRVAGKIPWTAYTIAFVEFCERFSYYGTTAVFVNFIQQDMPKGSNTGAGFEDQSGALGMGQRASTGLTTFNQFWAYIMPLVGGYIADQYLGRYWTILAAIGVALVGHCILIVSALPPVIVHPHGAIAAFSVGLVIMGMGVGGFKSNISPLIAEQYRETRLYIMRMPKTGERVIVDPVETVSRIYMYFYLMINVGSLTGSIGMVYAEKYVGFWLSYTLPTVMFCFCPMVMFLCRNKYHKSPPTGSVVGAAMKLWGLAMKDCWSLNPYRTIKNMRSPNFWEKVKPSKVETKPVWMTFDDAWVDEVRRGLKACTVFLWYPVYWLAYNQMTNNLTSQAATMSLHGVPNDVINNLNPISLIIFIPICDQFIYPALRRYGIRYTALKKICGGFFLGSMAMIYSTVVQYYVYKTSPCGKHANSCEDEVSPLNVWIQSGAYILIGFSEISASITGLEYAFTKAPRNMRSLVTGVFLLTSALSAAISQAFVSLAEDPLLVWNYGVVAVIAFAGGCLFWLSHRSLDAEEDHLNQLPQGDFDGKLADEEKH